MIIAAQLRVLRNAVNLSQRELAGRVGVSAATIDRIESGRTRDPGIGTVERILATFGYELMVTHRSGRPLAPELDHEMQYDRAGRHHPAHLSLHPIRSEQDLWWGWYRVAWQLHDPAVPALTYRRRWESSWRSLLGWPELAADVT